MRLTVMPNNGVNPDPKKLRSFVTLLFEGDKGEVIKGTLPYLKRLGSAPPLDLSIISLA